jgi:peptidyl-prolyl cis-trans isomerase D
MLKYMRTHATSWFIKILLGLIIVVFVLWGMGRIKSKEETIVAKVGGDYITRVEFDRAYQNFYEYYMRIFGEQVSPDLLKGLNIKQQALDQLINTAIIQQGIQQMRLQVSEEELRDAILQYPAFQRGGKFDRNLYERFMRSMGLDIEQFQAMIQRDLMNQRMLTLIGDTGVIIAEEEARELYFLENEQINLSFVKISPKAFTSRVTVTQSDLEGYYAEHREAFRTPAQVTVHYLRFPPNAYLTEAEVSPQEIQEFYDMNIEQYQRPARVRVRHILIAVNPEAGPDVVEKASKKAERVRAEARQDAQGADFAALARQYSDDPSASEGGDLGYFSRGEMDPALEKAVFSLGKGEISPVVRTRHGFHVVKVEDVQGAKTKRLDEVKEEISSHVMREKAEDLAAIHAEDAAYQAKKQGGLQSYADEAGLQVKEEGPFSAGESLRDLGPRERFSSMAFTLDLDEVSSAFQDGEDYFVLQVVDRIPPQIPPLEGVSRQVQGALVSSLAQGLAQSTARDLLIAWEKGEGFGDLLRAYGLKVEETGFVKRSSSAPPGIGPLGEHAGEIATLTLENPWPDDIIEADDCYVVVKLRDVKKVEEKAYEHEKDTYQQQLSSLKGRELLQGWLTVMKKEVDIEINQELLGLYR